MNNHPSRQQIRAAFEAAAPGYDAVAVLQREVADRLLERLELLRIQPRQILDLGCGTGYCSAALAQRYPKARIVALDLSEAMLAHTRRRFSLWDRLRQRYALSCGDAAQLPFADGSFDMIFSSLTLQWCADLPRTFAELQRVLRPGGVVQFASLGPDTLKELRSSWASVDDAVHVNQFVDLHDVGDAMLQAGLAEPVLDMEYLTLTYPDCMGLMRDLKGIGAHNHNPGRHPGLTGKRRLQKMIAAYEQFRHADGLLPATYELVYGHAWRGEKRKHAGSGEFQLSPDQIRR
ncbi:MAG: malonyl-ACP O-methyltransferase BioC [Chromatiales bacterium]|nr:malonyl-ACP O-methyltransferase BioC [Gammaproteobacteria bacterium]MBW6476374.1 malonyl-ACP O-methyltransferase BioC [Chromatiales bacterium]